MDSSAVSARLIGAIFVEKGLVTEEQLELALEQQRASGERLGEVLVEQFGIDRLELASALAEQWAEYERQGSAEERESPSGKRDPGVSGEARGGDFPTLSPSAKRPIGEIFVERGLVTDDQLEEALEQQRKSGGRLGEILVAGGRLSRLELASALADQWASFQKLRPPAEPLPPAEVPASADTPPVATQPLPTPDVAPLPPQTPAPPPELLTRVDALASRVDQLATDKSDWKPQLEKVAELLRARLEHLEETVIRRSDGVAQGVTEGEADGVRAEIVALAARIEALPTQTHEWRYELSQVAEDLRTRLEQVETDLEGAPAAGQLAELRSVVDALSARVDSLPAPSEEWRNAVAGLAARLDALPVSSGEWRGAVAELAARIDSLPAPSDELRDAVASLEHRVAELGRTAGEAAELHTSMEALVARVDALPLDGWRSELAEVAENLWTRLERVERGLEGASGVEELAQLRAAIEALGARVDSVPVPSEEWRDQIGVLAAKIDALTTDDWRPELADTAEGLRKRIERIEEGTSGQARAAAVTQIAEQVDELARRIADTDAVEARLHALTARVEALPASSEDWREQIAALAVRFDSLPVPSEGWRDQIGALAARIDALRTDEWRTELAQVADNLRTRLERVEHESGGSHAEQVEDLRARLGDLEARIDVAPVPVDDIRSEIAGLAQTFHGRVEQLEHRLSREVRAEILDGLSERIEEIAAKVDDTSAVEARLNESLSALVDERAARSTTEGEDVRGRLDDALRQFEAVAGVVGRVDEVESRLDAEAVSAADLAPRLDELKQSGERHTSRVEQLARHLEELASRRDATEVEHALTQRIDSAEASLAELHVGLDALPSSVEERITAAEARIEAGTRQGAAEVESLRRELDELRTVVNGAGDALSGRIDSVAESLRDELAVAGERFVGGDAVDELRSAIERHDSRLEGLGGEVAAFGRRADDKATARAAELDVLRTRLETVESALAESGAWSEAVDAAHARIERLEAHVEEFSAAEADERNAEIESLRGQLSERVEALERGQVKRKDLRELRGTVERVERRVDERLAQDDAAVRATEDAVREGIASLGERLSASGEAYLETGHELSRSIAGLGLALTAAEAHGTDEPRSTDRPTEISVFLAFAPTPEGYRLVECAGAAPSLDDEVNIEGSEGPLVVTRVGASPLPFDVRPCVYLERS